MKGGKPMGIINNIMLAVITSIIADFIYDYLKNR